MLEENFISIKRQLLLNLINEVMKEFNELSKNSKYKIVKPSIPILWFGNVEKYFKSEVKIITVGINPSCMEFKKNKKLNQYDITFRFPDYIAKCTPSLYLAYNNYFKENPYKKWFNENFKNVLEKFNASYYENQKFPNIAIHTDIASQYATYPRWGKLGKNVKEELTKRGIKNWHKLMEILEPDVILFSSNATQYVKEINKDLKKLFQVYILFLDLRK